MKQKYVITIIEEAAQISIREYAELEKGEFAFVCEELHDIEMMRAAIPDGAGSLVAIVRRPNMYPRQDYGEKIAQGIIDLLNDTSGETCMEIFINDADDFAPADNDFDPVVVADNDAKGGDDKAATP
jgi:hypothetical protein